MKKKIYKIVSCLSLLTMICSFNSMSLHAEENKINVCFYDEDWNELYCEDTDLEIEKNNISPFITIRYTTYNSSIHSINGHLGYSDKYKYSFKVKNSTFEYMRANSTTIKEYVADSEEYTLLNQQIVDDVQFYELLIISNGDTAADIPLKGRLTTEIIYPIGFVREQGMTKWAITNFEIY